MNTRGRAIVSVLVVILLALAGLLVYYYATASSRRGATSPSGVASCPGSAGGSSEGSWATYHGDSDRSGVLPRGPIHAVPPQTGSPTPLDGQVYAEPLACGDAVFVATEGDTVYAINASHGALLWHTHLGAPVNGGSLPCGDISPSGITGTPVIDAATGTLYVVAFLSPAQHVLFGLALSNGTVLSQRVVDPPGADPTVEQQRGALALANSMVYIPYGGLAGDCGAYHGWVVGVPVSNGSGLLSYQVPTHREGGIWAPGGITIAPDGDLLVSTGNGDSNSTYDFGDSVIELSPSLVELDSFAPSNWAQLNIDDTDLGSVNPTVLPNGDVFQIGKAGVGYLLSGTHLGGVGGQLYSAAVCSAAFGATAHENSTLLVPCTNGLFELTVGAANFSVAWSTAIFDAGPPIVTGDVVWAVDLGNAHLLGFNLTDGAPRYSLPLGSVDHFVTPLATPGGLFVGAGTDLDAFSID